MSAALLVFHFALLFGVTTAFDFSLQQRVLARLRGADRTVQEFGPLWQNLLKEKEALFSANDLFRALQFDGEDSLSNECKEDLSLILDPGADLLANTDFVRDVMLPMLDSSGKVGPGILRGHFEFKGLFSQCKKIDFAVPGRERHLKGGYFQIDIDNQLRNNDIEGSCNISVINGLIWLGDFTFDVCLPDSCSSADLQSIFRPFSTPPLKPNPICAVRKVNDLLPEINAGFYITVTIIGVFAVVSVAAGIADYLGSEKWKEQAFTKGFLWKLFMACSLYSNIGSIFNVESSGKEKQIGAIQCMRAVSMTWVLLGHSMLYSFMLIANPLDGLGIEYTFFGQIILSACLAVDTFFFLSGLMLTFFWFKTYEKSPRKANSVGGWIMFYVHRLWRLSPPYWINVLFYTFVFKQLFRNVPYNLIQYAWWDFCDTTWWEDILYIHNYADYDRLCTGYTWYLDTDLQIYLFTPLLLLPMAFKPVLAIILGAALMVISTGINMFMVFHYDWPATINTKFELNTTRMDLYSVLMYESPIIRLQPYLIGMAVGWMLQKKRRLRIHWVINIAIWCIAIAMTSVVTVGLYSEGDQVLPVFWRAMFSSFSRIAWALGLGWIVIACWYGYGGPINEIMSAKFWIPLGRLTYCGYLTQIPVIMFLGSLHTTEIYMSGTAEMIVTRTLPAAVITFLIAIVYSSLFEVNFVKFESLLFK